MLDSAIKVNDVPPGSHMHTQRIFDQKLIGQLLVNGLPEGDRIFMVEFGGPLPPVKIVRFAPLHSGDEVSR